MPESILQILHSIWMKMFHDIPQTWPNSNFLLVTLHGLYTQVCHQMCHCDSEHGV